MNQNIDEKNTKQPEIKDVIKIYKVGSIYFSGSSVEVDLSPLIKKIEDFVKNNGYHSYLSHEFVTVPYEIFPRGGGLNSDIISTISAYVTYHARVQA
ncbi:hypothetical protein KKI93_22015 [Xenorhabdus bovienii]|uniref:hypothetical protein n=1 Tax=Xenorhabdus bovienii TaxID=40576 RepID=UPI0023B2A9A5|nr:hypothetical protein [Xenorhabdus bovienii]MDE9566615.1 hypothetical protein [Xenorhabdus bovienii]